MKKPCEFIEIGGKSYSLKITASGILELEELLNEGIGDAISKLGSVAILAKFYLTAFKPLTDIDTIDKVCGLFDDFVENGGTYDDLRLKMMDVLVQSGVITKEAQDASKKMMEKLREVYLKQLN